MNRIYLKNHKNNRFQIRDILDDKKIGTIKIKQGKPHFILKNKYKDKLIETESTLLINPDEKLTFNQVYADFLQNYCSDWINLSDYDFPPFVESCRLKQCENDMFGRKTYLHPVARKAWKKMKHMANKDDIELNIVSAYRDLAYQRQLIQNKLNKGILIQEILKVNTLPGFSEHHTGCAIDIGSPNAAILESEFDQSPAFNWLKDNANSHGFYITYPKDNKTGIMYEPWHWCFKVKSTNN